MRPEFPTPRSEATPTTSSEQQGNVLIERRYFRPSTMYKSEMIRV
jgi:hypothetical protein